MVFLAFCGCYLFSKALARQNFGIQTGSQSSTNQLAVPLTVDPYSGRSSNAPTVTPATNHAILAQIAAAASLPQVSGASPALETLQPAATRQILAASGGAVAGYAPHKAAFAADINNIPAVNLWMRDGALLRSHIYGLCYFAPNGQSVFFATLADSEGKIQPPNSILYSNSFTGASADVLYTYNDSSMEQDIIIRKQLPTPASFGLDPATARLAVVTEFLNPPSPILRAASEDLTALNEAAGITGENTLLDQLIVFNTMRIGKGRAFVLGTTGEEIPVGKTWQKVEGRTFLIEATPYALLQSQLQGLPPQTSQVKPAIKENLRTALLRAPLSTVAVSSAKPMRVAQALKAEPGVVLDYLLSSASVLNIQFGSTNPVEAGFAATGETTNDYWNSYYAPLSSLHTVTNLLWSTTNASGASITVSNAAGTGSLPVTDAMYENYIYANPTGGNIGIMISNFPTGTYDFFLYGHGDSNIQNGIFSLTTLGTNYGTKATATNALAWTNTAWQEGEQFVTFRNVSVSNSQPIYIVSQNDAGGYAVFNGLQIMPDNPQTNISSLINIDVSPNGEVGKAAVGLTTNDLWNSGGDCNYTGKATTTNLEWSDGFSSSASFSISNSGGCWGLTSGDAMYNGYTYNQYDQPSYMTISNLANGRYDFYLYGHGNVANQNGIFQLSTAGVSYGTLATTTTGTTWETNLWQEGQQYVVFRDVWVTNTQPVSITINVDAAGYAIINGIQIVLPFPSDDTYSTTSAIPDWWLLQYGYNPHDPTVALADPDYDGRNNLQEYQDGTAPTNPASVSNVTLGHWRFDNTSTWAGTAGQLPLQASNITGVADWMTNAVLIDATNAAILKYRDVEANGDANINVRNGTVSFWFKPDWTSVSAGGNGPQDSGRLLEMGKYSSTFTNGWWSLFFTSDGNNLVFASATNSFGRTNLSGSTSLVSNEWYQITLTFTPSNSVLYLNGQSNATGLASAYYPKLQDRTNGFTIGTDAYGTNQARGQFDELFTYNYPLSAGNIGSNYSAVLPLSITMQPVSQFAFVSNSVPFEVAVSNATVSTVTYQWYFDGTNLPGQTNQILILTDIQETNAGAYTVVASALDASVTSTQAVLTVCTPAFDSISNVTVNAGSGPYNISLTGITGGCGTNTTVSFTASSSNPAIVSNLVVNYTNGSSTGVLTFTPAGSVTSNTTVTFTVIMNNTIANAVSGGLSFFGGVFPNSSDLSVATILTNGLSTTAIGANGSFSTIVPDTALAMSPILTFIPFEPVFSFLAITNGTTNYNLDLASGSAPVQTPDFLVVQSQGVYRATGLQPTIATLIATYTAATSGTDVTFSWSGSSVALVPTDYITNTFTVTVIQTNISSIAIINPTNGATFNPQVSVPMQATISAPPGTTNCSVGFYEGTNFIGASAVSTNGVAGTNAGTYQILWTPGRAGTNYLSAILNGGTNLLATSAVVQVSIRNLPTVSLTDPKNGASFTIGTNLTLKAVAASTGSTIASVAFFSGTNNLGNGSLAGSSYTLGYTPPVVGQYSFSASATDTNGAVAYSRPVSVTIRQTNQPPSVYAGPNQVINLQSSLPVNFPTNLSTNLPVALANLSGIAADDGLPSNYLSVQWSCISPPTNATVAFSQSNSLTTSVIFSMTNTYTLQLSATDGQYTNVSVMTVRVLNPNLPPMVNAGASQTNVLPAIVNTNPVPTVIPVFVTVLETPSAGWGIDYFSASNCIITSVGGGTNYYLVNSNGVATPFSKLGGLTHEIYLSSSRQTANGFTNGEVFTGTGMPGQIMRLEPNGNAIGAPYVISNNVSGTEVFHTNNIWITITNNPLDPADPVNAQLFRGGLWLDKTGVWNGDLIAVSGVDTNDRFVSTGYVYRIKANGVANLVAKLTSASGLLDSFEGVTTVPNNPKQYGPWAGKILVGGDYSGDLFAIDTNGLVVEYTLPFGAEDIRIIPEGENLFLACSDYYTSLNNIEAVSYSQFEGMSGDILLRSS